MNVNGGMHYGQYIMECCLQPGTEKPQNGFCIVLIITQNTIGSVLTPPNNLDEIRQKLKEVDG